MKEGQIIKVNGKLGKAVNDYRHKDNIVWRFHPLNSGNYFLNELKEIKEEDLEEVTIEDEDEFYLKGHEWLGRPVMVHRIGKYKIVEYKKKNFDTKEITGISLFSPVHDRRLNHSWNSLDEALLHCILKNNGYNEREVMFISNAFKCKDMEIKEQ